MHNYKVHRIACRRNSVAYTSILMCHAIMIGMCKWSSFSMTNNNSSKIHRWLSKNTMRALSTAVWLLGHNIEHIFTTIVQHKISYRTSVGKALSTKTWSLCGIIQFKIKKITILDMLLEESDGKTVSNILEKIGYISNTRSHCICTQ